MRVQIEKDVTWPIDYDPSITHDGNRLRIAMLLSDQAIVEDIRSHPDRESMGSTVVACIVKDSYITLAHVGDSRAYLIDKDGIHQITRDHSWVAEQVANGVLTPEEARKHPFRNVITQALGNGGDLEVSIQIIEGDLLDRLLLCSDGLSGMVQDSDILEIIHKESSLESAVNALVNKARENGGEDNITVILIGFQSEEN